MKLLNSILLFVAFAAAKNVEKGTRWEEKQERIENKKAAADAKAEQQALNQAQKEAQKAANDLAKAEAAAEKAAAKKDQLLNSTER